MRFTGLLNCGRGTSDPADTVLLTVDGPIAFAEIAGAVARLAERIGEVVPAGRRAAIMLPCESAPSVLVGLLACWEANQIAVPWRIVNGDADYMPALTGATFRLDFAAGNRTVAEVVPIDHGPGGEAMFLGADLILTSSGSTGNPKGIAVTRNTFMLNAALAGQALGLDASEFDIWACQTDLAFTSALCHLVMAMQFRIPFLHGTSIDRAGLAGTAGRDVRLGYGGSPLSALRLVEADKGDVTPTAVVTSGDFLRPNTIVRMRTAAPDLRINAFYGLSEFGGRTCAIDDAGLRREVPGASGYPLPGFEVEIRDEEGRTVPKGDVGYVHMRSPLMMRAYLHPDGKVERFDPVDWFNTHDIGHLEPSGCVVLQGRTADVFKVGGEQVNRVEIEACLQAVVPAADFAVIPVPHDVLGQVPALVVTQDSEDGAVDRRQIIRHIRERLPARCLPLAFYRLPHPLPRTRSGKLLVQRLCEMLDDALPL